ncbi:PAS domain S-box protein [Geminocystis sp. CENA526]|uniref:PAS domain S-box protein n=1 Tax=Geminocystis sp. CENA526 TaxID=1355871 RepID=UPI003D6EF829
MLNYTPLTIEELQQGIILHPLTVSPQATVREAIAQMSGIRSSCDTAYDQDRNKKSIETEARSSCVIVVEDEKVIGILTERDIVRLSIDNPSLDHITVGEVMISPVIIFRKSQFTDIFVVINLLSQHNIRHLPILDDDDRLIGLITHESLRQLSRPIDLLKLRQVKEVMIHQVICADEKVSLMEIAQKMTHHRVSCVVITGKRETEGQIQELPVGIVSERDLVQFQALYLNFDNYQAGDVMSYPPITVALDESLLTVQLMMEKHFIRRLLVTGEKGDIVGIVTQTNILKALNPVEIYSMATMLEERVKQLEIEKYALLYNRNRELEEIVKQRTKELENKAKREKLIAEITNRIRVSLHLEDILNTCVEELRAFSGCDRVLVYQFQPDWSGVIVAESVNEKFDKAKGNKVEDTCFQEYVASKVKYNIDEAIAIDNIYTGDYPDCYIEFVEQYQIKANLIVPIRLQNELWGLLIGHQCQDFRQWQEEDITLFQEIAINLAIAIQQSINYHKLENELEERQKAEESLKESESRFRQLAENIDQVFYLTDLEKVQILYISPTYENIWGKSCQSLYENARSYIESVHPEDQNLVAQAYESQKLGEQTTIEYRIVRPDGEIRWILDRNFPVKSSSVNSKRVCGIAEDITEGKLNEIELIKSQQQIEITTFRLKEAQRIAKLGHWEYNHPKDTLYWSKQCYSICGVNPSEFTVSYDRFLDLVHPDDRAFINENYNDHIKNQTEYNVCHRIITPDGTIKYVQEQCETEYDDNGAPFISRGTVQDITKLKQAELKLAQLNHELEIKVAQRTHELWRINHLQTMILDSTDYSIISTDCNGYIQTFNLGAEKMLGYCAEEVVGKATPLLFVDLQEVQALAVQLSQELGQEIPQDITAFIIKSRLGMVNEFTINNIRKDGTRFPILMVINPLKNEEEEIIGFLGIGKDITKEEEARIYRQQAEKALRDSELRFRRIFESNVVGFMFTDFTGKITEANDRFLEMLGYTRAELESGMLNWATMTPPEYHHTDISVIEYLKIHRTIEPWEKAYYHKDGHLVSVLIGVALMIEDDTSVCVIMDISDRKDTERKLEQSQHFLQTLLDTLPVCVVWKDRESNLLGCNRTLARLMNISDTIDISNPSEINFSFTAEELAKCHQDDLEVITSGQPKLSIEQTFTLPNGEVMWAETNKTPLKNNQGEIVGLVGIFYDVTQKRRNEIEKQKLLQELSAFKQGLDQSAIVVMTDANGVITYGNDRFIKVSGYSKQELIGNTHKIINSGYHSRSFFKNLWETINKGEIWRGEICNRNKSGHFYWVESTIVPFLDQQGKPFQYLAIRFDITARKLGEIRIQKENAFRQQILEQMGDGLCVCYDINEHPFVRFTLWNPKMEIITGYTLEEINQLGWYQSLYPNPEIQAQAIARMQRMRQGDNMVAEEWEIYTKHGTKRTVTISTSILNKDANSNITFVLGVIQDITERKAKEKENIVLKERLEFVLSSSPAIIYSCEANLLNNPLKFISQNVKTIVNYDSADFLSHLYKWSEFIHPEDYEIVRKEIVEELFTSNHCRTEYRFLTGDNKYIWLQDEMMLWRDADGNPTEIVGYVANINERKQAQLLLKNKTKELDRFFSLAIDLLCIANVEGYFLRVNTEWEKVLGYPLNQLEGSRFLDYVHPDDLPATLEAINHMKLGQGVSSFINRYRCADGSYRWLEWRSAPTDNYIYAAARDITERRKNEEHINRQLAAMEAALNGIAVLQGDNFLYTNKSHHEMFGYEQGELIGKDWRILYYPEEIDIVEREVLPQLMTEGASWYGEIKAKRKDGSTFEEGLSLTIAKDGLLICICQDITERKEYEREKSALINTIQRNNDLLSTMSRAESQFITAENRLTIFEQLLTDLLELTDSEYGFIGEVLFRKDGSAVMEENFLKIKGVPYLQTHSVTNIAWNEETQKLYEENYEKGMQFTNMNTLFGAVIMTGKAVIANNPSTDPRRGGIPDGHPPLNAFLGLPFFSGDNLIGIVGIANAPGGYDQSMIEYLQPFLMTCSILIEGYRLDRRKKLTEEQLFQSNQDLIRANRLKDEFLANMSHELRTPLNAILGMTEGLCEEVFGDINERQLKALKTIDRSGTHLLELINDILDLAKIEAEHLELQLDTVSLNSLCESSLTFVKQLALKKRIQLKTELPSNIPCLTIDERRIRQVLINLLNNAVKFTTEGGNITIKVNNNPPPEKTNFVTQIFENPENITHNYIYISIIDTGIGIPPNKINTLFEPFVQVDTALNRQYSGTGLGLALVKKIVELHGGYMILSSKLGVGSCFTIALPYTPSVSIPSTDNNQETTPANIAQTPIKEALILLVEDNEANISTISSYLKAKGYRLILAENGEDAIVLARSEKPDIILMDIQMPKMSGLEAIERIRQNPECVDIPIIALTALAMENDREKCLQIGANEYLTKPLKLKELVAKIQELLTRGLGN